MVRQINPFAELASFACSIFNLMGLRRYGGQCHLLWPGAHNELLPHTCSRVVPFGRGLMFTQLPCKFNRHKNTKNARSKLDCEQNPKKNQSMKTPFAWKLRFKDLYINGSSHMVRKMVYPMQPLTEKVSLILLCWLARVPVSASADLRNYVSWQRAPG